MFYKLVVVWLGEDDDSRCYPIPFTLMNVILYCNTPSTPPAVGSQRSLVSMIDVSSGIGGRKRKAIYERKALCYGFRATHSNTRKHSPLLIALLLYIRNTVVENITQQKAVVPFFMIMLCVYVDEDDDNIYNVDAVRAHKPYARGRLDTHRNNTIVFEDRSARRASLFCA